MGTCQLLNGGFNSGGLEMLLCQVTLFQQPVGKLEVVIRSALKTST